MNNANRDGYFYFSNHDNELRVWIRDIVSFTDMIWMKVPIINVFVTCAFYVWIIIIGMVLKVWKWDKAGFAFVFMYFILILTAIAGPCNAIDYERYIFPCILGFPVIIGVIIQRYEKEEIE